MGSRACRPLVRHQPGSGAPGPWHPACISTGRPVSCAVLSGGGHLPGVRARCGQVEPGAASCVSRTGGLVSGETGPRGDAAVTREPGPRPRPPTLHVRLRGPLRCLPVSRAGVRPPPPVLFLPPAVGPLGQHSWRPPRCWAGICCPLVAAPTFCSVSEPRASRAAPPRPPTRPSRTG